MRCLLVLLAFTTTVYSSSYTSVETPPTRERLQGPLDVDDKEQCELACDCARGEVTCPLYPRIEKSPCKAYYYRYGKCALLGDSIYNSCTTPITEYVLTSSNPGPSLNNVNANNPKEPQITAIPTSTEPETTTSTQTTTTTTEPETTSTTQTTTTTTEPETTSTTQTTTTTTEPETTSTTQSTTSITEPSNYCGNFTVTGFNADPDSELYRQMFGMTVHVYPSVPFSEEERVNWDKITEVTVIASLRCKVIVENSYPPVVVYGKDNSGSTVVRAVSRPNNAYGECGLNI